MLYPCLLKLFFLLQNGSNFLWFPVISKTPFSTSNKARSVLFLNSENTVTCS